MKASSAKERACYNFFLSIFICLSVSLVFTLFQISSFFLYRSLVLSITLWFSLSLSHFSVLLSLLLSMMDLNTLYYLYHCTKGQCQEKTIRKVTIHNILILFVEKYFNCDLFHLRNRHKGANLHCLNKLAVEIEKNHHFQCFSTKHFFIYIPISYSKGLKWQFWSWNE